MVYYYYFWYSLFIKIDFISYSVFHYYRFYFQFISNVVDILDEYKEDGGRSSVETELRAGREEQKKLEKRYSEMEYGLLSLRRRIVLF